MIIHPSSALLTAVLLRWDRLRDELKVSASGTRAKKKKRREKHDINLSVEAQFWFPWQHAI